MVHNKTATERAQSPGRPPVSSTGNALGALAHPWTYISNFKLKENYILYNIYPNREKCFTTFT
jgi:hypothetical protein